MKNTELKFENKSETKDIVVRRDGKKYLLEWFDSKNFEGLEPVKQVYGYLFDDEEKLLITNPNTTWRLPGGGPEEQDENFEETLIRETDEEADVEIEKITPLGYLKITPIDSDEKLHYALRYVAKVKKIKPQTKDVAIDEMGKREFISPDKFSDYCDWGEMGKMILNKAVERFIELK